MSWVRTVAATLMLGVLSTTASAFQEQGTTAPGGAQKAPAAGAPRLGDEAVPQRGSQGTEIRIPGFGRIGTLPKLDFGMELLYGTQDQRSAPPQRTPGKPDDEDGLAIRGAVKHKF